MANKIVDILQIAKDKIKQLLALKKDKQHYVDSVIRNEKSQVLLLQRSYQDNFMPGKWCLPGGKIEKGELPLVAAERELEEETGLKQVQLTYLTNVERVDSISLYYEGFIYSAAATLLDNNEHYRLQWVDFDNLKDYDLILDLGSILPQLPLTVIDATLFRGAPIIGEDLYTTWLLKKQQFDKGELSDELYLQCIKEYKQIAAFELVKRAFDKSQITDEQFATYLNKTNTFNKDLLKSAGSCIIEQLVEIV